jgi:leader peptidase (prepilin peptidase)/N-methyltransferase
MHTVLTIYLFLLGTTLASFLNALMYRIDKEYKYPEIFTKPSHCEKCKKQLKWYDLIPILSYIFTKGKCSKCKEKISIYYPISELFLGISLSLLYYTQSPWYTYPILLVLFSLAYFDIIYKAIPQTPTLIFLGSSILYLLVNSILNGQLILNATLSGLGIILGITVILLLMYGIKNLKEGFGFGDFIILLSLSIFLSTKQFWLMFWVSIMIAAFVGVIGMLLKKYNRKSALPLLPFFTIAYIIVVAFGNVILKYLGAYFLIL